MANKLFDPAQAARLEDPERLQWSPPDEVLRHLQLTPAMTVADIGAGTGYFALPMAREVKQVYAVDLQPEMLELLRQKLEAAEAPGNIKIIAGDAASTNLDEQSCDRVLLANIWHELPDARAVLREMGRVLKAAGRIAILDWRPDAEHPPGPPREHRISLERVMEDLHKNGWRARAGLRTGLYHYLVIAERS